MNYIKFEKKNMSERNKALMIGSFYRQALIECGYSPDFHIYDLKKEELALKKTPASQFLISVIDHYNTLDGLEKAVFVSEILERGRHYRFWWLSFFNEEDWFTELKKLWEGSAEALC